MRRLGIKLRTYENANVFLKGTAGRGQNHWASQDFTACIDSPSEITYFSENSKRAAIALHGDHVHVLRRNAKGSLIDLSPEVAERELLKFVEEMRALGVQIEFEK